jgi:ABC-type dipeptide/oligopeptide/nickel transport system permease component
MGAALFLRRLLLALPTLLGVIVVVFILLRVVPGDPIALMITGDTTPADVANLRHSYGMDRSIPVQFFLYLLHLLRGDFGVSISLGQDVLRLVLDRLPATLELAFAALVLGGTMGLCLGLAAVHWRGRWPEKLINFINAVAAAVPEFLWGLILILVFAVFVPILPISGRRDPTQDIDLVSQFYVVEAVLRGEFGLAADLLRHLVLPAIALALPMAAIVAQMLKSSLQQELVQDYILLARSKGFSRAWVLFRYALPNAMISTVTVMGVHFVFLVGGTVLVELIFGYPGIGNMLYGAAINRDLPLIQGITIGFAVLFICLNVLIEGLYSILDPRVKRS